MNNDAFAKLMEKTRLGEMLDASVARHKLAAERGDNMPLEIRAAFLAAVMIQATGQKDLQTSILLMAKAMDPELLVHNFPVFARIHKTLLGDMADIMQGSKE